MTTPNPQTSLAPPAQAFPFIIREARTPEDIKALCLVRSQCYARHDYEPELWQRFVEPEEFDSRAVLLMAVAKDTGECIGTIRVNFSTTGPMPMCEDENVSELNGQPFAYVDRFAVNRQRGHVEVRLALMKAMWLLVCDRKVPWVVACAMAPLARLYHGVGLRALVGAEAGIANPKLHPRELYYVVGGGTLEILENMREWNPSLWPFFTGVQHPDIPYTWPPTYVPSPAPEPEPEVEASGGLWPLITAVAAALLPDMSDTSNEEATPELGAA